MDNNFLKVFEDLTIKASNIETSMSLLAAGRKNFQDELVAIDSDVKEIQELQNLVKESIDDHKKDLMQEYNDTRQIIERVTEKMFFVMNQLDTAPAAASTAKTNIRGALREIPSPAPPRLFDRADAAFVFSELNTPRMSIQQYAKSPMIKKKSRAHLNFSDFEAEISKETFEKIPTYMRGRTSLSELQDFLDSVVIKCFNEKYEILYKSRAALKQSEFQLQLMYKEHQSLFEKQKFITIGDLSRIQDKNVGRKEEKWLQCLRHVNIIKEVRKNGIVFFIWLQ